MTPQHKKDELTSSFSAGSLYYISSEIAIHACDAADSLLLALVRHQMISI
jgi:hypothetical protein